jgi:dihydrofolate synthase/folylpolyglutamate synthase
MFGRFQHLQEKDWQNFSGNRPLAPVIIDVGHNPHAARYLATQLAQLKQPNQKIFAVFSALKDKDLSGIVEPLDNLIDEWYCAGLNGWRGQSGESVAQRLQACLPNTNSKIFNDVSSAAKAAFEMAQSQDLILIFGSFHTVGDFWLWLNHGK